MRTLFTALLLTFPLLAQEKSCLAIGTPHNGGSGTIVAKRGTTCYVLTNRHVINKDSKKIWVVCNGTMAAARFVASHPSADLTLCAVELDATAVPVAEAEPKDGTAVRHYGKTSGPQRGKITGTTNFASPDGLVCNLSYFSVAGDSGAGVFNDQGELCGVHYGRKGDPEGDDTCGLCVRLPAIRELLRQALPPK